MESMPRAHRLPPEPRWPALVALVSVGALNLALPPALTPGPDWLVLVLVASLQTPAILLHRFGKEHLAQMFSYASLGVATLAMVASLTLLIRGLPAHTESPSQLLLSATLLWVGNLLIFASWYWRLDAGGPHQRDIVGPHTDGAFLFPQMM